MRVTFDRGIPNEWVGNVLLIEILRFKMATRDEKNYFKRMTGQNSCC